MKKTFLFRICTVIALVVILLLWNRSRHGTDQMPPSETDLTATGAETATNAQRTFASTTNAEISNNQSSSVTNATAQKRDQQLKSAIAEKNLPINFWGKVVDQDGNPIAGVQIQISLRRWTSDSLMAINGGFSTISRETDGEGRFDVTGESGDLLELKSVTKEGYRLSPNAIMTLNYERTPNLPTESSPILFKMWKIKPGEHLVTGSKFFGIVPDGRIYTIDLLKGTKKEGEGTEGDLHVSIMRSSAIQPHEHYDWSFTLQSPNGGLVEAQNDFMYEAPSDGYQPQYQTNITSMQEGWGNQFKRHFFIRSREGSLYGRLDVEVLADYNNQSVFKVDYSVNPNGSRNLEDDGQK